MSGSQLMRALEQQGAGRRGGATVPAQSNPTTSTIEPIVSRELLEKNSPERLGPLRALESQGMETREKFFKEAIEPGFTGVAPTSAQIADYNECKTTKARREQVTATLPGGKFPISAHDVMVHGAILVEGYTGDLVHAIKERMKSIDSSYDPKKGSEKVFDAELTAELKKHQQKKREDQNSTYRGESDGIVDNKLLRQIENDYRAWCKESPELRCKEYLRKVTASGKTDSTDVPNCGAEPAASATPTPVPSATPEPAPTVNPAATVDPAATPGQSMLPE